MSAIKTFIALPSKERRIACRMFLSAQHGVDFSQDVHAIPISGLNACAETAKAIGWRKSVSSSMSIGAAFFVYLSRDVQPRPAKTVRQGDPRKAGKLFNFNFAKGR